jgi:hypothetical protein
MKCIDSGETIITTKDIQHIVQDCCGVNYRGVRSECIIIMISYSYRRSPFF